MKLFATLAVIVTNLTLSSLAETADCLDAYDETRSLAHVFAEANHSKRHIKFSLSEGRVLSYQPTLTLKGGNLEISEYGAVITLHGEAALVTGVDFVQMCIKPAC
jgi:hypothetical protein